MDAQFDAFVTVPDIRHLSPTDDGIFVREICLYETIEAIDALNLNKADGMDDLNNDYFEDTQSVLASAKVAVGNKIL